jgi:lipopolysaccharide transport system ATP-binding protein
MHTTPVLTVDRLGKAYRRYQSEGRRVLSLMGLPFHPVQETWVLRDVSFAVHPGEAVGIVGQNGAGKSTLLKLVTGTTRASEGTVVMGGRVGAILELGMGFVPDFTGRQNVYHAGSLMGLGHEQLQALMSEIEDFAEIGGYFDQPVRTYSSGMQVRVAFAIATAVRPDLLIIDEALSVGDTYFQHKSFDRIRRFRGEGTTLLIVSHDSTAVQTLCSRAILLDKGRLLLDGPPVAVMDYYNALIGDRARARIEVQTLEGGQVQTTSGTGQAKVTAISLRDEAGQAVEMVSTGQWVELRIKVEAFDDIPVLVLGYQLKDRLGQSVFGTNTFHTRQQQMAVLRGECLEFRARFQANLGPASYSVSTALVSTHTHLQDNYEWRDLALLFHVANPHHDFFEGSAWVPPEITVVRS